MVELLFYNSVIVTVSLAVCAVLATIGAMLLARNMFHMSTASVRRFFELRFRPTALRYTEEFECLFESYREKSAVLEPFTENYTNVFNEARWATLVITLETLRRAHEHLCHLIEEGESKDALCLSEFLIAAGDDLAPWKYRHINDEWAPLANWEQEAHLILSHVMKNLPHALQQAHKIGIVRDGKFQEAMRVLDKIRADL
jgi:hypothetical protein